ncbi:hypothetical protein [Nocardioides sp. ChNu-99]|uniref:hypothetical protein n=1 Tax=Nocardioides sp. ChNu-99 TaxID=2839897 RepID=UPI002404C4A2|nr:hypothetical protein [Nocardioides sp. ChNu-99]MDF9717379.1 hypothetical protein [Nocardioides sp. ChNu-99]
MIEHRFVVDVDRNEVVLTTSFATLSHLMLAAKDHGPAGALDVTIQPYGEVSMRLTPNQARAMAHAWDAARRTGTYMGPPRTQHANEAPLLRLHAALADHHGTPRPPVPPPMRAVVIPFPTLRGVV